MESNELLANLIEGQRKTKELHCNHRHGIAKNLLEKYKPSEGLKLLAPDDWTDEEQRAA